jgi:oxygen-independent coproporphyrinogen-3 oxidase
MKTLYIHIPFCQSKCFYCSFAVSVGQEKRMDAYVDCLIREMDRYQEEPIKSIYWGGGTPAYLGIEQIQKLAKAIDRTFDVMPHAEFTMEANPEGLDQTKLNVFKEIGVNRLSLGVQSLNDKYLKYLGRNHSAEEARQAYGRIREAGFHNVNVDLMLAFPDQTLPELMFDLEQIMALQSEHLSLYTLTIEENSRFFTKKVVLSPGSSQAELYTTTLQTLEEEGFKQYEISNFAQPRFESAHNMNYWMGGDYIGIGMSAHSYLQGRRSWNVAHLMEYMQRIENHESPIEDFEELSVQERLVETFLFNLRMNRGVDLDALETKFQSQLSQNQKEMLENFIREGFLRQESSRIVTTLQGKLVLDELCARLI